MAVLASRARGLTRLAAVVLLAGCAALPPVGEPLSVPAGSAGYRFRSVSQGQRADDLLLLVTFSGGGNRAAAMAYGTLEQLASDRIGAAAGSRRMLDAVDVISSVSGGSIVGAYFVLHGDQLFTRFRQDYLYRNAQSALLWRMVLSPVAWRRLASSSYARGDLFADYLDRHLFQGATFADLAAVPDRPFLVVNATDLSAAGRFEFTQDWFDVICTNLDSFPVARAVAASSAYPVLMTPIVVRNHAGRCGYQPSPQLAEAAGAGPPGRAGFLGERIRAYQDPRSLRYLQLSDGALSDNLGIRAAIDVLLLARDFDDVQRRLGLAGIRRVAVIAVDAAGEIGGKVASKRRAPGAMASASLSSMVLVEENAAENRALLHELFDRLAAEPGEDGTAAVETYWIDVRLADLADEDRRRRLRAIPTNLSVPRAQVDELICSSRELLGRSEAYARLLADLGGGRAAKAVCADLTESRTVGSSR